MIMSGIDKDSPQNWQTEGFLLDLQVDCFGSSNSPIFANSSEFVFHNSIYGYEEGQIPPQGTSDANQSLRGPSPCPTHIQQPTPPLTNSPSQDLPGGTSNIVEIPQQDCSPTLPSMVQIAPPMSLPSLVQQRRSQHPQDQQQGTGSFPHSEGLGACYTQTPPEYIVHNNSNNFLNTNDRPGVTESGLNADVPFHYAATSFAQPVATSTPSTVAISQIEAIAPAAVDNAETSASRRRSQRLRGQKTRGPQERRKNQNQSKPYSPSEKTPKRKRSTKGGKVASSAEGNNGSRTGDPKLSASTGTFGGFTDNYCYERDGNHALLPINQNSLSASSDCDSDPKKAYLQITEQPQPKALRFRYICEGRSAGSIPGVRSKADSKTYPAVKICNFKGSGFVKVSCVTRDPPHYPHPHNLVGKEGCKDGICTVNANDEMECIFPNLGIQCIKRKNVEQALSERQKNKIDPFETGYGHLNHIQDIDLNAVRLCFQGFVEDAKTGKIVALKPVVSNAIYDKKATTDLSIYKMSECSSTVEGGKEIILLCEKVAREDIEVRFYEFKDGRLHWEEKGEFQTSDVHKQVAICLRTPKYKDMDIEDPVTVNIQLLRPSDKSKSEPRPFTYLPLSSDSMYIKKKMERISPKRSLDSLLNLYLPNLNKSKPEAERPPPPPLTTETRNFDPPLHIDRIKQVDKDSNELMTPSTSPPVLLNEKIIRQKRVCYRERADDLSIPSTRTLISFQPDNTIPTHSKVVYQTKKPMDTELNSRLSEKQHSTPHPDAQKRHLNILHISDKEGPSQKRVVYKEQIQICNPTQGLPTPPPLLYDISENTSVLMETQDKQHHLEHTNLNLEPQKRPMAFEHQQILEPRQIVCYNNGNLQEFNADFANNNHYIHTQTETQEHNTEDYVFQGRDGTHCQDDAYYELRTHIQGQIASDEYTSPVIIDLDTHRRVDSTAYTEQALASSSPELGSLSLEAINSQQNNAKVANKILRELPVLETQNSYNNLDDLPLPEEINLIY